MKIHLKIKKFLKIRGNFSKNCSGKKRYIKIQRIISKIFQTKSLDNPIFQKSLAQRPQLYGDAKISSKSLESGKSFVSIKAVPLFIYSY